MVIRTYKWWWLVVGTVGGMSASALMVWNGGVLKLYNDIPSLIGYLSLALLIYKIGINVINRFFEWASSFGYELYLMHSLVFSIVAFCLKDVVPLYLLLPISFLLAYVIGYGYNSLLNFLRLK